MLEVTVGSPKERPVAVHGLKLDGRRDGLVITGARGVQLADHGRQFNSYRYRVEQGHVPLGALLERQPQLQRALSRLVDNPRSWLANHSFRHCLTKGSPVLRTWHFEVARPPGSAPGPVIRVPARAGDVGRIVLSKSKGLQIGNWVTQRNKFTYRVERPELNLAAVLRDSPRLARGLAAAIRHPDNPAARRAFAGDVTRAFRGASPPVSQVRHQFRGASRVFAAGDGIQLGAGNTRVDTVTLDVGRVVLTGWDHAARLAGAPEFPRGDQPGPEGFLGRVAGPRPPGFLPEGRRGVPAPDLIDEVGATTARAALAYWSPGREHLVGRLSDSLTAALASPRKASAGSIGGVHAYLSAGGGGFQILRRTGLGASSASQRWDVVPDVPGASASAPEVTPARSTFLGLSDLADGPRDGRTEAHGVVGAPAVSSEVITGSRAGGVPPGGVPPGGVPPGGVPPGGVPPGGVPPGGALPGSGAAGSSRVANLPANVDPGAAEPPAAVGPVAVVLCGPADELAAQASTQVLDRDVLLRLARQHVWAKVFDGTAQSVARAVRAAGMLGVVVFFDPAIGAGLWVDVDQARQVPVSSLLITLDMSAGPPGSFHVFAHEVRAFAHDVSSVTRS